MPYQPAQPNQDRKTPTPTQPSPPRPIPAHRRDHQPQSALPDAPKLPSHVNALNHDADFLWSTSSAGALAGSYPANFQPRKNQRETPYWHRQKYSHKGSRPHDYAQPPPTRPPHFRP